MPDIGQNMHEDDTHVGGAEALGGLDKGLAAEREHLAADEAGEARPAQDAQHGPRGPERILIHSVLSIPAEEPSPRGSLEVHVLHEG